MKPGDVVGGRYRLAEPLASGGMGTVWLARHVELDVDVAIKVISDAMARAPTALARFQREARAAAQLRSPHVVQVFDYGVHEEAPYLAMELLRGEDLRTHITRVGAMPLGRVADIVEALAKALRLAHAAGIVHRDLKPANVFLHQADGEETVKILDFGIAKDLTPHTDGLQTSAATVVGSPLYMSPEQVRGAEVDHRTDLWSLAVLAYEMVTGRQPFEGASLGDVFARIVADAIPPVSTFVADLPPAVIAFFDRALARAPEGRFADAPSLAAAFRAAIGAQASAAPRVLAPVSRARGDAPTLALDSAPVNLPAPLVAVRTDPDGALGAEAWPTSAGARTAPRARESGSPVAEPPDEDPGPVAERRPRPRRTIAAVVTAGAVAATVGVVLLAVGRDRPSPVPAASREVSAARAVPSVDARPSVVPEPHASPPTPAASSASPRTSAVPSSSADAASGGSVAQPSRPRPHAPGASTPARPPAPPTGSIDPIFGVPVQGR